MSKDKEAADFLGYKTEKCLRLGDCIRARWLQDALDHGARFSNVQEAEKYLRWKRQEVVVIVGLMVIIVVWGLLNYDVGFKTGLRTYAKVCQLIILNGG